MKYELTIPARMAVSMSLAMRIKECRKLKEGAYGEYWEKEEQDARTAYVEIFGYEYQG